VAASESVRELSRQLIAYEAAKLGCAEGNLAAADRVCETIRRPLSTLAGTTGFRALLTRALTIEKVQAPSLSAVSVKPDGSLDGLADLVADGEIHAGVGLVSQLLGLLATLIGESLTIRIVVDIWPDLDKSNTRPIGEGKHD